MNDSGPEPAQRRRGWLVFLGFALVAVSLPICLLVFVGLLREAPTQKPIDNFAGAIILAGLQGPLALGLFLAHRGEPGIGRRLLANGRSLLSAAGLRWLLSTSIGLGGAIGLASLALMYAFQSIAWLVALVALCLFAVLDPVLNVFRRSWWLGGLLSIGVWIALLSGLVGVADQLNHMREDTMVYLFPFMIYAAALPISGVLRLVRRGLQRASASAAESTR